MITEQGGINIINFKERTQANEQKRFEQYILNRTGSELKRKGAALKIYHNELFTTMVMPATQNTSGFQEIIYRRYFAKAQNTSESFPAISTASWIRSKNGLILPDVYERIKADAESSIDFYPNSSLQGDNYDNSFKVNLKNRRGTIESIYDKEGNLEKVDIIVGTGGASMIEDEGVVIFDNRPNYTIRRRYSSETQQDETEFETSSNSEKKLIFKHEVSAGNVLTIKGSLSGAEVDNIQIPSRLSRENIKQTLFPRELYKDPFNMELKDDDSWRNANFTALTGISWRLEQHAR